MDLFPNDYRILIMDKKTKKPIGNIATKITIFATRKNNYHLFPSISDDYGYILFSKEWLNEEIEKESNLFIMDYACRLKDCLAKLEILVMSAEDVNDAVCGMELYKDYFNYSSEDIKRFSKVDNKDYKSVSKVIDFSGKEVINIVIDLEKKSRLLQLFS